MAIGRPHYFKCSKARGVSSLFAEQTKNYHKVTRTGKTKPNPSRSTGGFSLHTLYEYTCTCGHVGWTSHPQIMFSRFDPTEETS